MSAAGGGTTSGSATKIMASRANIAKTGTNQRDQPSFFLGSNMIPAELIDYGFEPYEGVLLAYLPKLDGVLQEHVGREYTLYSLDGVAYDCMPPMKWWKVKGCARAHNLDIVEPIWSGAVADFRVPEAPRPDGHKLYVRGFSGGPWICIQEAPKDREENNEDSGATESAEEIGNSAEVRVV